MKIEVQNFSYRYPNTTALALDKISFSVAAGEFVGIIGESGAGKSSLCQALVGLIPHFYHGAVGGQILINGQNTLKTTVDVLSQQVGLVFQNPFTQISGAKLTVFEEVAFGLENIGLPRAEMRERAEEVLELMGIAHLKDRNPFALSGGQMQRLAIACIMALKPDIIVLDEPTSQLDPSGTEEVFSAVEKLREKGMTVIMVEQKMEKLALYADKILLLHRGKVVDFAPPSTVFSRPDLSDYGVMPPAYTRAAVRLNKRYPGSDRFPVTLNEAVETLEGKK